MVVTKEAEPDSGTNVNWMKIVQVASAYNYCRVQPRMVGNPAATEHPFAKLRHLPRRRMPALCTRLVISKVRTDISTL